MSPFIAGNWKMHGLTAQLDQLRVLADALASHPGPARVAICPPMTLLSQAAHILQGSRVELGAQDCHGAASGAFTGDISAEMLADVGARLVILGHSERRTLHGETDAVVAAKVLASLRAGLEPIICVGENSDDRKAGRAVAVVDHQLAASLPDRLAGARFHLAYEPVWAIGSGVTPSSDEIAEVHGAIRRVLTSRFGEQGARVHILYGGSVKPANAADILRIADVGGALVGGASLAAAEFLEIIASA
jgi:triosephosphate isomerase